MRTSLLLRLLGATFASGLGLTLAACGQVGDRADHYRRTGETCLPGKMCSQATPHGLRFQGAQTGLLPQNELSPVAVGGTATFSVVDKNTGWTPAVGIEVEAEGEVFTVGPVGMGTFQLRGRAAGAVVVRVLERGTRLLLDRTTIQAYPVTGASATVYREGNNLLYESFLESSNLLFVGTASVFVTLHGGGYLVDESATISLEPAPGASLVQSSWNSAQLTTERVGDITLVVTPGDGVAHRLPFRVVDHVDAIEPATGRGGIFLPVTEPVPASGGLYCFRALSGGEALMDAPWRFAVDPGGPTLSPGGACVQITRRAMAQAAPFTLRVSVGAITRTFAMRFA